MLSKPMAELLTELPTQKDHQPLRHLGGPNFQVNRATTQAGSWYEKLRYLVDYKDEHTIRAAAIERMLKRLLLVEAEATVGRKILEELVQVGYIENDTVPEACAEHVQQLLGLALKLNEKTTLKKSVIIKLLAFEIERYLFPNELSEHMVSVLYQTLAGYVEPKNAYPQERFATELHLASRKVLLEESDDALLNAHLRKTFGLWWEASLENPAILQEVADRIKKENELVESMLSSPVIHKIANRIKNEALFFSFVRQLIDEKGNQALTVLEDKALLTDYIENKVATLYPNQRQRIVEAGTRAVVYLFITKVLLGVALELPYDLLVYGSVHYVALLINVLFFPALLYVMVITAPRPKPKNTDRIIVGISQAVHMDPADNKVVYVPTAPWSTSQQILIACFYIPLFVLSFGTIVLILHHLHFNVVSMALFLFFLCIVSYFGLRLRYKARRYIVEYTEESTLRFLIHLARLPLVRTGRFISQKLARINIFILILDGIIETPFKILLGSFDQFVSFVKDTRRDLL